MTPTATALFSGPPERINSQAEDAFFRAIRNGNRTFKFTGTARLSDLDEMLVAALDDRGMSIGSMLDIGISSGVTTLELIERIGRAGHVPEVTATDLMLSAHIVPTLPGCRALVDPQGHILQYEFFGRAMNPWRRRLDYVTGMALVRTAAHWLCDDRARQAVRMRNKMRQNVALVTPRLTARLDVRVVEDDIMVRNPDFVSRFDLVRAANILITRYFPERLLRKGLANAISYLSGPGALLLIARTLERSGNHATLFVLNADGTRLEVVERVGEGSEVEALVLDMPVARPLCDA